MPALADYYAYYAFGMLQPGGYGRGNTAAQGGYRYGHNGQEHDGTLGLSHYTAQYWEYDARLARRWNLDPVPLTEESQYAAFRNNPVRFSDRKGDCPGGCPPKKEPESRTVLALSGASNILFGIVGTMGAIVGAPETLGATALAIPLTIGEIGIGMAQVADATLSNAPNPVIHKSSSLPGLVAHGVGAENAAYIDAVGQFIPGTLTGGNFAAMKTGVSELKAAVQSRKAVPAAGAFLEVADAYQDITGVGSAVKESFENPVVGSESGVAKAGSASKSYNSSDTKKTSGLQIQPQVQMTKQRVSDKQMSGLNKLLDGK